MHDLRDHRHAAGRRHLHRQGRPVRRYHLRASHAGTAVPNARAIVGTDRYATSALVAATLIPDPHGIVLATGAAFPDGLAGVVYAIHNNWSLLLVSPRLTELNPAQTTYLRNISTSATNVTAVGGTDALPATSVTLVTNALR